MKLYVFSVFFVYVFSVCFYVTLPRIFFQPYVHMSLNTNVVHVNKQDSNIAPNICDKLEFFLMSPTFFGGVTIIQAWNINFSKVRENWLRVWQIGWSDIIQTVASSTHGSLTSIGESKIWSDGNRASFGSNKKWNRWFTSFFLSMEMSSQGVGKSDETRPRFC